MATLFAISVTILIAGFLWFFVGRPILESFGMLAPRVRDYATVAVSDQPLMSPDPPQTEQTDQTDRQTDQESEADQWLDRLEVDRTQTAVIELLVYSGWKVGEIRSILKGDSGALGIACEEAKQRLGITGEPRMLAIRDNGEERKIPMFPEKAAR